MGLKSCCRVVPGMEGEEVVGESRMFERVILEVVQTICDYRSRI